MKHFAIVGPLVLVVAALVYFGLTALGLLPEAASAQAASIDWLFNLEVATISFLFALIVVPLVYSLIIFRRRKGETGDGEHIEGNTRLEIAWTVIPLIVVLVFAYLGAWSLGETRRVDPQAMVVKVTGFQWGWEFQYPDSGVVSNQLYLPVNQQVLLQMTSRDVIHSFWVPEFRLKQDLLPGRVTELRITPTVVGEYNVICSELCGGAHAYMVAPVVVVSQTDFAAWTDDQLALAAGSTAPDAAIGQQLAQGKACLACHSVDGSVLVGPTWKGLFGSQVDLADGTTVTADEIYITTAVREPNAQIHAGFSPNVMPVFDTTSLTDVQLGHIIAFIQSLK